MYVCELISFIFVGGSFIKVLRISAITLTFSRVFKQGVKHTDRGSICCFPIFLWKFILNNHTRFLGCEFSIELFCFKLDSEADFVLILFSLFSTRGLVEESFSLCCFSSIRRDRSHIIVLWEPSLSISSSSCSWTIVLTATFSKRLHSYAIWSS